ncbi:MAG: oligosaccharide flippase family protein [Candidatus Latescibacterota bacterium]|nr:oligosaccharide flippase family protein [Candidatus Latescibacterota bacterium]
MDETSLATRTIRGTLWTGSAFALQIVTTLVFYHVLVIDDMGLFQWCLFIVMFLALLSDLGLGSALVQKREAQDTHFDSAFWLCLVTGIGVTAAVMWNVEMICHLTPGVDAEQMGPILSGMAWIVPFAAVSGIFRAKLQRELHWRSMAGAEIASSVGHAVSAFGLLALDFGILSAVYSAVIREVVLLIGLGVVGRWRPGFSVSRQGLALVLTFGLNLTGSRCINYINSNLARLFIFPVLGPEALGYYSFAYQLTLMPLVRISTIITRVFFPTFSAIQEDDALLRRAYVRATQAVALVYWPTLAAVIVFAPQIISVVLENGDQALWPLRLLALATVVKAVGASVGSIFLAKGRASWALYWSGFSIVVLLPSLYVTVHRFGLIGVCIVIAATAALFLLLSQHLANYLIRLPWRTCLAALGRPALLSLWVGALSWLASPWLPSAPAAASIVAGVIVVIAGISGLRLWTWDLFSGIWASARGR